MKKLIFFLGGGGSIIVIFLLGMGIYTRIYPNPIIFFASLILGMVSVILGCFIIQKLSKKLFDSFTIFTMSAVYYLGIIILSVFGPTFIDRSISYHIVFYAAEKEEFYVEDIEREFSKDIFNKRIYDAVATGFLKQNKNGSISPTIKSKIMYTILKPIGEVTNSMSTYYEMKKKVEK